MTITIYELLGMFKKGKFPKKICIYECVYIYDEDYEDYIQDGDLTREHLFEEYKINDILDDEVEILEEEKKIEKLKWNEKSQHNVVTDNTKKTLEHLLSRSEQLKKCLNEVIDEINKLKEDK